MRRSVRSVYRNVIPNTVWATLPYPWRTRLYPDGAGQSVLGQGTFNCITPTGLQKKVGVLKKDSIEGRVPPTWTKSGGGLKVIVGLRTFLDSSLVYSQNTGSFLIYWMLGWYIGKVLGRGSSQNFCQPSNMSITTTEIVFCNDQRPLPLTHE